MPRPRFQTGHLYQKGGVWKGRFYDEAGVHKNLSLGRGTRTEAKKRLAAILAPINARSGPPEIATAGTVIESYLTLWKKRWKASTAATTEQRIRQRILPILGERLIRQIKREDLQTVLDEATTGGAARSVISHLRWDLSSIFQFALADGYIDRNPALMLYVPREAKRTVARRLTDEDARQVISLFEHLPARLIFRLALGAGLRTGELFALRWDDIWTDEIHVRRRLYQGKIDTTKTGKERSVAITPAIADELEAWRDICPHGEAGWIFPSEKGETPVDPYNWWKREARKPLAEAGYGWVTIAVCRRTHATLAKQAGVDPKVSADQMGHTLDVNQTVYVQSPLSMRKEAAMRIEKLLKQ